MNWICGITFHVLSLLILECIAPTDCPNGGSNYQCNGNLCECPSPFVLSGNKCVGKLTLKKNYV